MKLVTFLVVVSIAVALVLAFPGINSNIPDIRDIGLPADALARPGVGGAATPPHTDQLRQPRHLLSKMLFSEPKVIVQPILVQPQSYYPIQNSYIGAGRGYNYGYGYKNW